MTTFTVEQANRTLPLVRRIVEDVVREHLRWQEKILELELVSSTAAAAAVGAEASAPSSSDERVAAIERDAMAIARDIDAFERELEALGIVLKDRRLGLIDFPGEIDGRKVWLCWRLGEPAVQYWHDLDAGYAGRQPLPTAAIK